MGYLFGSAARGGYVDDYSGRKVRLPRFAMNGRNWPMNGACDRRMSVVRGRFVVAPAQARCCIAATRRRGTSTPGACAHRGHRAWVAADRWW
ncbi:hypothetical protein [Burkholderia sp. JP2-270]|uniref:hypothetical protein n=1 Tax=Burkholderia sp. JP2-270 TaxID=2217913 RepID=UPI0013A6BE17|nr:hypothetical protein [Burkholderia sp. JP2-270]